MTNPHLASKKNVILLVAVVAVAIYLSVSYYQKKNRQLKVRALGGGTEIVSVDNKLPKPIHDFFRFHAMRFSYVDDYQIMLQVPAGTLETNVRAYDNYYPLAGKVAMKRGNFSGVNGDSRGKKFNVLVNQQFLDKSGVKFGEIVKVGDIEYKVNGIVESLPDARGEQLNEKPLILMRRYMIKSSGIDKYALKKEYRYLSFLKKITPEEWQERFQKRFPKSTAVTKRWNQ